MQAHLPRFSIRAFHRFRLLAALLCLCSLPATAAPGDEPLIAALQKITKRHGTRFVYEKALLKNVRVPVQPPGRQTVEEQLKSLLHPQGLLFILLKENEYAIVKKPGKNAAVIHPAQPPPHTATQRETRKDTLQELKEVEIISTGYNQIPKDRATGAFSIITARELQRRTNTSLTALMEGMVPGLFIQYQGLGLQNMEPETMMRGVSTFGSTQPLIVVDGFPIEAPLSTINPNDVARISFLRDAAAAAIWGVKASNGVIVIDTKKGSTPQTKVAFRSAFSYTTKPSLYYLNQASSAELADLEMEEFALNPLDREYYNITGEGYSAVTGVLIDHHEGLITAEERDRRITQITSYDNRKDIARELFGNNYLLDNTISFSAAPAENFNYYASFGFTNGNGLYIDEHFRRANANFNVTMQLMPKLRLTAGLQYTDGRERNSAIRSYGDDIGIPYGLMIFPYDRLRNADGTAARVTRRRNAEADKTLMDMGYYDGGYYPATDWQHYNFREKTNNLRMQAFLTYRLTEGISLQAGYKSEKGNRHDSELSGDEGYLTRSMLNQFALPGANGKLQFHLPKGDWLKDKTSRSTNYYLRGQLNVDQAFRNHPGRINAVLGTEWQRSELENNINSRFGYEASNGFSLPVDQYRLLSFPNPVVGEFASFDFSKYYNNSLLDDRYVSYYFSGAYEYKNRYSLSASARVNKSSRFDQSRGLNRELLGSAGLKWNIGREAFLSHLSWLDQLQLRFTSGLTGNVPPNTQSPYRTNAAPSLSLFTRLISLNVLYEANRHLKWESTLTNNLGVDFSFLGGRLSGAVDLYHKKTNDLLGSQLTDPTLIGAYLTTRNVADMTNKGIELQVSSVLLQRRRVRWSSTLSAAYNKNTVNRVHGSVARNMVHRLTHMAGYPAYSMWAYRWAGLSSTGLAQYYRNGQSEIVTNQDVIGFKDLRHTGSIKPTYTAGLVNTVSYRQWELSFLLIANGGNKMQLDNLLGATTLISQQFDLVFKNVPAGIRDRWRQPGDEAYTHVPRLLQSLGYSYTDVRYQSAAFVKLREAVLAYQFTKKDHPRLPVSDLRLQLQGRNLCKWVANSEGIDPEAHLPLSGYRTLPVTPTYTFGAQVNF